jgi:hypothetical protein
MENKSGSSRDRMFRYAYNIFIGKLERKRLLGKSRRGWEDIPVW